MKLLFGLILSLFINVAFAQSLNWASSFGSINSDLSVSLSIDPSGNIYNAGHFFGSMDLDPGPGVFNVTSVGGISTTDIYIQKFNASGGLIWAKKIGGLLDERVSQCITDNIGNIYLTGYFNGTVDFDPGPGTYNLIAANADAFVLKLDSQGNFVWAKSMGGSSTVITIVHSIDIQDDLISLIGRFNGTTDFDPGAGIYNLTTSGNYDVFVVQLDTSGVFSWAKSLGGTSLEYGESVKIDPSGNNIVAGYFQSAMDFDPGAGIFNLIPSGTRDAFILKLNQSGDFIWAKSLSGPGWSRATNLSVDEFSNIYVSGGFIDSVDFDPGPGNNTIFSTLISSDGFILKLNSNGDYQWVNVIKESSDPISDIDFNGEIYITGRFADTIDVDPSLNEFNLFSTDLLDVYLVKYSSNSDFIGGISFGGIDSDTPTSIGLDNSSIYICGGFFGDSDFDPSAGSYTLTSIGDRDSYLVKFNQICSPSYSVETVTSCNSFLWMDGNTYTSSNNSATWTLTNVAGCDSIVTLNLTINNLSTSSTTIVACDSYTWNGTTYASSGTYTWMGTNAAGCDSTATLNLTINNSSTSSTTIVACESYTWNGTTYTSSGTYTWMGTNAMGCDSTATLNLTINNSSTSSTSIVACDSYTWNGTTYTSSGTYTWMGTNAAGCDSTATLNLTINNSSISSTTIVNCDSYTWNGTTYSSSGTYTWTGTNSMGCDSVATLNLTINQSPAILISPSNTTICPGASVVLTATGGNTYLWDNGAGSSNPITVFPSATITYSVIGTDVNGCSSSASSVITVEDVEDPLAPTLATLSDECSITATAPTTTDACAGTITGTTNDPLTYSSVGTYTVNWTFDDGNGNSIIVPQTIEVTGIPVGVTLINQSTLTADATGYNYQWIDCSDNSIVVGATNQTFIGSSAGNYAVIVSNGSCSDTSSCSLLTVGIDEENSFNLQLFPNPSSGIVQVTSDATIQQIVIRGVNGQVVYVSNEHTKNQTVNVAHIAPGVYQFEIKTSYGVTNKRFIKL